MIPYGQETIIGCDKMCEDQTANDRRSHNLHVLGKYRTIVAHVSWLSNGTQMSATALRQLSQPTFTVWSQLAYLSLGQFFLHSASPNPSHKWKQETSYIITQVTYQWNGMSHDESIITYNYPVNNTRSSTNSTTCLTQCQKHPTPASTGCCRKYRARMSSSWYLAQTLDPNQGSSQVSLGLLHHQEWRFYHVYHQRWLSLDWFKATSAGHPWVLTNRVVILYSRCSVPRAMAPPAFGNAGQPELNQQEKKNWPTNIRTRTKYMGPSTVWYGEFKEQIDHLVDTQHQIVWWVFLCQRLLLPQSEWQIHG